MIPQPVTEHANFKPIHHRGERYSGNGRNMPIFFGKTKRRREMYRASWVRHCTLVADQNGERKKVPGDLLRHCALATESKWRNKRVPGDLLRP
jgi:hypothetical protein